MKQMENEHISMEGQNKVKLEIKLWKLKQDLEETKWRFERIDDSKKIDPEMGAVIDDYVSESFILEERETGSSRTTFASAEQ